MTTVKEVTMLKKTVLQEWISSFCERNSLKAFTSLKSPLDP